MGLFKTRLFNIKAELPKPPEPTPPPLPEQDLPGITPQRPNPNQGRCPHSTAKIIDKVLKQGQELANTKLRPYQVPFARRIVESVLLEDVATVTGLFSRQCTDPYTMVLTASGPTYIRDLAKGQQVLSIERNTPIATTVTDYERTPLKEAFELRLHNGIPLIITKDHLIKNSSDRWTMLSDGTLNLKTKLQTHVGLLIDHDEPSPLLTIKSFYAAQVLLHKRHVEMDPEHITLTVPPKDIDRSNQLLNVAFVRNQTAGIYALRLPKAKQDMLLEHAFLNPQTTMQELMRHATLTMGRNNRKKVPVIYLEPSSNRFAYDALIYFFRHHGINPEEQVTETGTRLKLSGWETMQRLEKYFTEDSLHPEMAEYINSYEPRRGYMLSPADLMRAVRAYPELKQWWKRSTYAYYRDHGILLCTLLNTMKKIGLSEADAGTIQPDNRPLVSSLCFAPIQSITRTTSREMVDIETLDQQFFGNTILNHNSGKTETIAVVCDAMMLLLPYLHSTFPKDKRFEKFRDGFWIGIFSPSKDQSKTTYDRMRFRMSNPQGLEIMRKYGVKFTINSGDTIQMTNGSLTRCQTASKDANIESKTYHLIIVEEAQDVSPFKIRKSIEPMRSETAGTMVMVGTCNTVLNDLYEQIERNTREFKKTGVINHFEVEYKEVEKYSDRYKKTVAKAKEKLGEDSDEFKMSYCNVWCFERGMAFTEQVLSYRSSANPKGIFNSELEMVLSYRGMNPISLGVDIGKAQDFTVLTAVETLIDHPFQVNYMTYYFKRILGWKFMVGDNYTEQIPDIAAFARAMKAHTVVVDTTSLGSVVYDHLEILLDDRDVLPYHFSSPAKHEVYTALFHAVNGGFFEVPSGPKTEGTQEYQHFAFQARILIKEYKGKYLTPRAPTHKIDGKDPHDDFMDSWALANWGANEAGIYLPEPGNHTPTTLMESGRNEFLHGSNDEIVGRNIFMYG